MALRTLVACGLAVAWPATIAAQSHDAPKAVPASTHAAPTPVAAPAAASKPAPPAPAAVKLSEVRGRINAALAAQPEPSRRARPRRAGTTTSGGATATVTPTRYELRWPQDRWQVQWPTPPGERLTLSWPQ